MILFVKNVGNLHWVLDVAVNPFHLLAIVTGADLDEHAHKQIYGFMHIDPLEGGNHDGTIEPKTGVPKDSPWHV